MCLQDHTNLTTSIITVVYLWFWNISQKQNSNIRAVNVGQLKHNTITLIIHIEPFRVYSLFSAKDIQGKKSKYVSPLASSMRIRLVLPFSRCLITLRVFIFWLKLPRHDNPHPKLAHLIINWVSKCAKSQHSKQVWRCFYSISYYYREYVLPAGRFIYMQFICNWVVSEYRNTRKHCQTDQTFAWKFTGVYVCV